MNIHKNANRFLPKLVPTFLILFLFFAATTKSFAFLFEVPILDKDKISQLSDDNLTETYIDVLVEVEAVKTFYAKGGLVPKEYDKLKALLRYKIELTMELQKRKLDIPRYNQ